MQLSLPEWLSAYSIPGLSSATCRLSALCPREQQNPFSRLQALGYEPYFRTTIELNKDQHQDRTFLSRRLQRARVRGPSICTYQKHAVSWSALRRRPCLRPAHRSHRAQPRPVTSVRSLAREKATKFLFLLGPEENNGASPHITAALKSPRTPGNSHFWPGTFRRRLFRALALSPNPGWNRAGKLLDWIMGLVSCPALA